MRAQSARRRSWGAATAMFLLGVLVLVASACTTDDANSGSTPTASTIMPSTAESTVGSTTTTVDVITAPPTTESETTLLNWVEGPEPEPTAVAGSWCLCSTPRRAIPAHP